MADKRFIIHIASEIVVIASLIMFFFKKKNELETRIDALEKTVHALNSQLAGAVQYIQQLPIQPLSKSDHVAPPLAECVDNVCPVKHAPHGLGSSGHVPVCTAQSIPSRAEYTPPHTTTHRGAVVAFDDMVGTCVQTDEELDDALVVELSELADSRVDDQAPQ